MWLERGSQKGSLSESSYVSQLKRMLSFAHNKAKQMAKRQQAKHRKLYDQRCRGAELEAGDLVLVKQTAWKGRHKIQDRWEGEEYQVVGQPTLGVPVYTVQIIVGAGLGSFIGTYYCLCKGGQTVRWGEVRGHLKL